jgi:hypothetical protein
MKTLLGIFYLLALFASPVMGQKVERKAYKTIESKSIKNLDAALKTSEEELGFPVLFPSFIPDDRDDRFSDPDQANQRNAPYYAHTDVIAQTGLVIISISPDKACHGSKHCSVLSLHIKKDASPEMRQDMSGKAMTEVVKLSDNIKGYYTPGHPMADFWPPSLQWVKGDLLYDLWWSEIRKDDEKSMASSSEKILMDMANSAIHEAFQKKVTY